MRSLLAACIFFFLSASFALAQSDSSSFNIRVFAGTDDEPPTTPTLISATPVSTNQIDLAWTTATDNFVLGGYVVYRRGSTTATSSPIATTTLTTYFDVGLTPSTTYIYSVRAFDINNNYSSSSNEIEVATLDVPFVEPAPVPGQGTVARVVAESVIITEDVTSAEFDIETAFQSRLEIKWGRTAAYELGYVASEALRKNYVTTLTDLEPGTIYEYEIIGYTPRGRSNVVERGQFRTLDYVDLIAPANVKRFQAVADVNDVDLSWELPDDDDIDYVRIVRSHLGYPTDPLDGATVYLGLGTSGVDAGVLENYSPAYYTAFVYDTSGNISSGAIAIVFADSVSDDSVLRDGDSVVPIGGALGELSSTTLQMPELFDFIIRQNDLEYSYADTGIKLSHADPFLITLPVDRITRNLKSIIVELQDPTDQRQSYSFLLRLNKDQTAYEAVIAPLEVQGVSFLRTNVYDYQSLRVAEYLTQIGFTSIDTRTDAETAEDNDSQLFWQFLLIIGLLLLVILWWIIGRDDDDEEEVVEKVADEDKATETPSE